MTNQIHATMHTMEAALRQPACDRSPANTCSRQLHTRDNSVLHGGKRRNRRIDSTCLELCITVVHNASHPPSVAHEALRNPR